MAEWQQWQLSTWWWHIIDVSEITAYHGSRHSLRHRNKKQSRLIASNLMIHSFVFSLIDCSLTVWVYCISLQKPYNCRCDVLLFSFFVILTWKFIFRSWLTFSVCFSLRRTQSNSLSLLNHDLFTFVYIHNAFDVVVVVLSIQAKQ